MRAEKAGNHDLHHGKEDSIWTMSLKFQWGRKPRIHIYWAECLCVIPILYHVYVYPGYVPWRVSPTVDRRFCIFNSIHVYEIMECTLHQLHYLIFGFVFFPVHGLKPMLSLLVGLWWSKPSVWLRSLLHMARCCWDFVFIQFLLTSHSVTWRVLDEFCRMSLDHLRGVSLESHTVR